MESGACAGKEQVLLLVVGMPLLQWQAELMHGCGRRLHCGHNDSEEEWTAEVGLGHMDLTSKLFTFTCTRRADRRCAIDGV